jgi:hypothetical protein
MADSHNANAIIKLGSTAICARCETELYIKEAGVERFTSRTGDITFVIEPCEKCLSVLKHLKAANITIHVGEK